MARRTGASGATAAPSVTGSKGCMLASAVAGVCGKSVAALEAEWREHLRSVDGSAARCAVDG